MTNATVDAVVSQADGPLLTLTYKGGKVKVTVPADANAPLVTVGPGDRSLLVVGAAVFFSATRAADASLSAARVLVRKEGVVPPM
jgi:hypothetical protein